MYERDTYNLFRYELVAPKVRNDGSESNYTETVREALAAWGFTGWTEMDSVGYWHGKLEAGTTFVIYATEYREETQPRVGTDEILMKLARDSMPDQDAIQIVKFPVPVKLIEG